LEISLHIL